MDFDLIYKIKDWALDGEMNGFEELGWIPLEIGDDWEDEARMAAEMSELGFDYMSLLKGGAGMLQGAGGLMSGGGGGGAKPDAAAQAAAAQAKAAAESSARTWKIVGGIALGLLGLGGIALVARRA